MSEHVGHTILCEQCEEEITVDGRSKDELRSRLEEQGWAPYGTGVTPFAEENAERGQFACPRCTNESLDERLNRIARDAINALDLECAWVVIRDQNSASDFLRIRRGDKTVQIAFEHHKTDREMRDELVKRISAALSLNR
jgi:hypothetical protein